MYFVPLLLPFVENKSLSFVMMCVRLRRACSAALRTHRQQGPICADKFARQRSEAMLGNDLAETMCDEQGQNVTAARSIIYMQ